MTVTHSPPCTTQNYWLICPIPHCCGAGIHEQGVPFIAVLSTAAVPASEGFLFRARCGDKRYILCIAHNAIFNVTPAGLQRNVGDDAQVSTLQSGPVMLDDIGP